MMTTRRAPVAHTVPTHACSGDRRTLQLDPHALDLGYVLEVLGEVLT
jgi:hypothetical protein